MSVASKPNAGAQKLVGAAAAAVLILRAQDARHVPRLALEDGSPTQSLKIAAGTLALFGYEKFVGKLLQALGITKVPSTLAAMLSTFAVLRLIRKAISKEAADSIAKVLGPGVDWLGKWMSMFVVPPLAAMDKSLAALPAYSAAVWGKTAAWLTGGWAATHGVTGVLATQLAKPSVPAEKKTDAKPAASTPAPAPGGAVAVKVPLEDALRKGWVFLGALGYLGVACSSVMPQFLLRISGMVAQWSTVMGGFLVAKKLPKPLIQVFHPLVITGVLVNLGNRVTGPLVPFQLDARGAGDRLFQLLPAAMAGLGIRMYNTSKLWYDDPKDFTCVVVASSTAGLFSMLTSLFFSVAPQSPLSVPPPMSLPLLQRCVMTALGIESSKTIGPECDPRMSVAGALITGCLGASFGGMMFNAFPGVFNLDSALVRGVATGCSGVSTGTANLIGIGDVDAGAIAGASMCLAGAVHTMSLQIPGVVPAIRSMASLPALA